MALIDFTVPFAIGCCLIAVVAKAASGQTTAPTSAPAAVAVKLYLGDQQVQARKPTSVVIAIRNLSQDVVKFWPLVQLQHRVGLSDGTSRPARMTPEPPYAALPVPDGIDWSGLNVIVTITGDYSEPLDRMSGVSSIRLTPLQLKHDETHMFVQTIFGNALQRGSYMVQAAVYDKDKLIVTSNVHKIEVLAP